jgi:hypothetical protein
VHSLVGDIAMPCDFEGRLGAAFRSSSFAARFVALRGSLTASNVAHLSIVEFAIYSFDPPNIDVVNHVAREAASGGIRCGDFSPDYS